jgi:class 3 adenylate cyclase
LGALALAAGEDLSTVACSELERMLSLLEEFSTFQSAARQQTERALATVLFTDIVGSTAHAAALGDRAWRQVLDRHDGIAQSAVSACAGRLIKRTGDGILATFDVPAHGLECAKALRAALAHAEIAIRAGVHTGEVELREDDVAGIGVNIAARVAALAGSSEVLVSRTVRDLVAGGGYAFTSRGSHSLRGVPGRWELLAVG